MVGKQICSVGLVVGEILRGSAAKIGSMGHWEGIMLEGWIGTLMWNGHKLIDLPWGR